MNKILLILFVSACMVACSKKNKYAYGEFNPKNIKEQVFKIALNRDTILKTKSGVLLKFGAKTFKNAGSKDVEVIVKEIISKADILKSGVPTLDEKGQLLESGGMMNIMTNPKLDINPDAPIQVSIPTEGANVRMKKYTADIDNGDFLWKNPQPLAQNPSFDALIQGEQLFIEHCASCHSKNLSDKLTGPPLGCLEIGENKRSREWLLKYTKNSQKMIAQGDKIAVAKWLEYRPTVMTNFEFLTDLQINQIYNFIDNESIRQNICDGNTFRKYISIESIVNDSGGYSLTYEPIMNNNLEPAANEPIASDDNMSSQRIINYTRTINNDTFSRTYYYTFPVYNYQWINCDCNFWDGQAVDAFDVFAEANLEIFLIFKNRKALWPFVRWKGHYILIETEDEPTVTLPMSEPVTLLAFDKLKDGKRSFCELQTAIKSVNDIQLKLQNISENEFQKILKKYE